MIFIFSRSKYVTNSAAKQRFWCIYLSIYSAFLNRNSMRGISFRLVSLFNGISTFAVYLMPKPFSWKNSCGTIEPVAGRIRGHVPFPKVNVIARLEYELAYYDSAVHRFNHYTTFGLVFWHIKHCWLFNAHSPFDISIKYMIC